MKHYITAIAMALLCVFTAGASSAEFKRIWIETNAPHDGEKGVMIHADFDLKGVKDKGVQCQAIFYAVPGKRALHDINGRYRLSPSLNYGRLYLDRIRRVVVEALGVAVEVAHVHYKRYVVALCQKFAVFSRIGKYRYFDEYAVLT